MSTCGGACQHFRNENNLIYSLVTEIDPFKWIIKLSICYVIRAARDRHAARLRCLLLGQRNRNFSQYYSNYRRSSLLVSDIALINCNWSKLSPLSKPQGLWEPCYWPRCSDDLPYPSWFNDLIPIIAVCTFKMWCAIIRGSCTNLSGDWLFAIS